MHFYTNLVLSSHPVCFSWCYYCEWDDETLIPLSHQEPAGNTRWWNGGRFVSVCVRTSCYYTCIKKERRRKRVKKAIFGKLIFPCTHTTLCSTAQQHPWEVGKIFWENIGRYILQTILWRWCGFFYFGLLYFYTVFVWDRRVSEIAAETETEGGRKEEGKDH